MRNRPSRRASRPVLVAGAGLLGVLGLVVVARLPAPEPVVLSGAIASVPPAPAPTPTPASTMTLDAASPPTGPAPNAFVVRVVDGDTLLTSVAGRIETVRLLAIDTPETHRPNTPVECFGPEAAAALTAALPAGTPVRLERDVEPRDRYGRLLAYVTRADDGLFVNLALARAGLADALAYPPNLAHADEVAEAVLAARSTGLGLWGACGGGHEPVAK